jgi:hypothetical protein
MTKLFLLFLLYSVVVAIMKKRAAKKAAENGGDETEESEIELVPSPTPKQVSKEVGRKSIDLGPDRSYKEAGSRAPEAKSQKVSGKSLTTESEETDRDEHRRSQRESIDWDSGEHAPKPVQKSNPAKTANKPSQPVEPSAAKKAGREVLDMLARELGLPLPNDPAPTQNAPKYKPPIIPEVETVSKKPTRQSTSDEIRNSNWDGKRNREKSALSGKAKSDDPYARQGNASSSPSTFASKVSAESLREPSDVAHAMVMQSLLGEPPGMRLWKQRLHSRPKSQP